MAEDNRVKKLTVSSSPHVRSSETTTGVMLDVIIALAPAGIAAIIVFGLRALAVMLVSVASCVLAEYLSRKAMKKENTIGDLSAVVTGLLLAYNLPSNIPFWIVILGAVIAIVVVKQMFGGIGQNFVNPALAARIILLVSFPAKMTTWTLDGVTTATPLASLKSGAVDKNALPSMVDMLIGQHGG